VIEQLNSDVNLSPEKRLVEHGPVAHSLVDRVRIGSVFRKRPLGLCPNQLDVQGAGNAGSHFALNLEKMFQMLVKAVRPDVRSGRSINQLSIDSNFIPIASYACDLWSWLGLN
jgi:hypothetical protein